MILRKLNLDNVASKLDTTSRVINAFKGPAQTAKVIQRPPATTSRNQAAPPAAPKATTPPPPKVANPDEVEILGMKMTRAQMWGGVAVLSLLLGAAGYQVGKRI